MGPKFTISRVLVPIAALVLLYYIWKSQVRWAAAPVVVALALYYYFIPRWVDSRLERFHREALTLLTTGKAEEIPGFVRRSVFLQIFGPAGPLQAKLGLAYVQLGRYDRAIPALEWALRGARPEERVALQSALARALSENRAFNAAEEVGLAALKGGTRLPDILAIVAHARVQLGKLDENTASLLDEAESLSPSAPVVEMIDLTRKDLLTKRSGQAEETGGSRPADSCGLDPVVRRKRRRR